VSAAIDCVELSKFLIICDAICFRSTQWRQEFQILKRNCCVWWHKVSIKRSDPEILKAIPRHFNEEHKDIDVYLTVGSRVGFEMGTCELRDLLLLCSPSRWNCRTRKLFKILNWLNKCYAIFNPTNSAIKNNHSSNLIFCGPASWHICAIRNNRMLCLLSIYVTCLCCLTASNQSA